MAQNSQKSVLLTRFSALGDVAMTIPVVYSACASNPGTHFVMVTRKSMVPMFVNAPANLTVVGAELDGRHKGPLGLYRLVREMVQEYGIDVMVDLHDVLRTKIMRMLARLRGVKVSVLDKGRADKSSLTQRTGKVMLPLQTSIERYRQAFVSAGLPVEMRFTSLYGPSGKADAKDFAAITAPKGDGERWVGIAPFAAHAGKVYPLDKMEEVVRMLAQQPALRMFIFGAGPQETAVAEDWAQKYASVTSLAGKRYGFPAELALLSHIDVMLTMDSGNMHLASIAGTRTLSIWGATHHFCGFIGWRQSEDDMVQVSLPCRPCSVFGDKECYRHDLLCLNAIRPETVVGKVLERVPDHKQ